MIEMIKRIASDLKIPRDSLESEREWQDRVAYSAVGLNMLAAACGQDEDVSIGVSMQRVLYRGCDLLNIFNTGQDISDTVIAIRTAYVQTGHLLHKPNRLAFPQEMASRHGEMYFIRGQAPWTVNRMSGLGILTKQPIETSLSLADMYHLGRMPLVQWYKGFERTLKWQPLQNLPTNVEFLNIHNSPFEGYWNTHRPKSGISLCREIPQPQGRYMLLKIADDSIFGVNIDEWLVVATQNHQSPFAWQTKRPYLSIAIALRILEGNVPSVTIKQSEQIAVIESGYLLPPHEQAFYELLTWPKPGEDPRWNRIAATDVVPALKDLFSFVGYTVKIE